MKLVWNKPVIICYKERRRRPERTAFAVVKARELTFSMVEENAKFEGNIKDFFPLMGDIDYISSKEGLADQYVLCWFDDEEEDFNKAWRRFTGVTFPVGISCVTDRKGKKTCNAPFKAEQGKVE